jgi:hypothetical protein
MNMRPEQRKYVIGIARMIAPRLPTGVVRNMVERAAADQSTDSTVKRIDEQVLMVIHEAINQHEDGRAHSAAIG